MPETSKAHIEPAGGQTVRRDELFASLPRRATSGPGGVAGFPASLALHTAVGGALFLLPLLVTKHIPDAVESVQVLTYSPAPAPAPPLPLGTRGAVPRERRQTSPPTALDPPTLVSPSEATPVREAPQTAAVDVAADQVGDPKGSPQGMAGGIENGVPGGQLGGAPDGVLGGCLGCAGTDAVADYDQPPRVLRITRPEYPRDAFLKKIEGTVDLEIWIDEHGRVAHARVLRSVPLLDEAALHSVYEWRFAPAVKHGRPVTSMARAPVTFRLL